MNEYDATATHVAGAPPGAVPDVEVVQVEQKDVPIFGEWIGTLDGFTNADVTTLQGSWRRLAVSANIDGATPVIERLNLPGGPFIQIGVRMR